MRFDTAAVLACVLALAACMKEQASVDQLPVELQDTLTWEGLPPTRNDSVRVNGIDELVQLRLVVADSSLPSFVTYVPSDLAMRTASTPGWQELRWESAESGSIRPDAYIAVRFYAPGTTREAATLALDSVVGDRITMGGAAGTTKRYDWSLTEKAFTNAIEESIRLSGHIALGEHDGRFFHVVIDHPVTSEDGFAPRARVLLQQWRWSDKSRLVE